MQEAACLQCSGSAQIGQTRLPYVGKIMCVYRCCRARIRVGFRAPQRNDDQVQEVQHVSGGSVTAAGRSRSVRTHNKEVRHGWKNLEPLLGPQFVCNCVLVVTKYLQAFAQPSAYLVASAVLPSLPPGPLLLLSGRNSKSSSSVQRPSCWPSAEQ